MLPSRATDAGSRVLGTRRSGTERHGRLPARKTGHAGSGRRVLCAVEARTSGEELQGRHSSSSLREDSDRIRRVQQGFRGVAACDAARRPRLAGAHRGPSPQSDVASQRIPVSIEKSTVVTRPETTRTRAGSSPLPTLVLTVRETR